MKKTWFFVSILFLYTITDSVKGQQSIAVSGDYFERSGGSVSYTLGEVMVSTFTADNISLTQGLQQPYLVVTALNPFERTDPDIMIFPNPVQEILTVKVDFTDKFSYTLHDGYGRLLEQEAIAEPITEISFISLSPGTYYIKIVEDATEVKIFKIVKQ
jgi:hypothetical protein